MSGDRPQARLSTNLHFEFYRYKLQSATEIITSAIKKYWRLCAYFF